MTAPRVGETFQLDLDGTAFAGRYIEVDPPHRMLLDGTVEEPTQRRRHLHS